MSRRILSHIPYPRLQFCHPIHQHVKIERLAVNEETSHVRVVSLPILFVPFWNHKVDGGGVHYSLVDILQRIHLAMLHYGIVERAVRQSVTSISGVHQFLQVIQVTRHTHASWPLLLEFFRHQEHLFQKCVSWQNCFHPALGIGVFGRDVVANQRVSIGFTIRFIQAGIISTSFAKAALSGSLVISSRITCNSLSPTFSCFNAFKACTNRPMRRVS